MSARTYACPSCGAQVDEHCRRCHYCDAPVATLRCAACFHMSVADAVYCAGCGGQLGLEPLREAGDLPCPFCKAPLDAYRDGASALYDCARCGGQFVEHVLLRQMIERHAHPTPPEGVPPRAPTRPKVRTGYVPCPACASLMNRKNFGGTSGVIVDVCKKHGTWFDLGELPRVLAFVAAGGLERSRQRAEEEAAHARREHGAAAFVHAPSSSHDPALAAHVGASLADLLVDLLRG